MSDDDDVPQLSAHALAALQEFYSEQQSTEDDTQEDWQLSQFWYDDETAKRLSEEAMAVAGDMGRIACISCPTLYKKLITMKKDTSRAVVLEYDRRFEIYGEDFIFYDFKDPLALPDDLRGTFDLVVADPPFLSEECLRKTAQTIKFLAKDKVLLCTGAVMESLSGELLGTSICSFKPGHERNLANEFRCYANYNTFVLDKTKK